MKNEIEPITKCRSCNSEDLSPILSLGKHYVSNFVESEEEQGMKVPLELVLCNQCKLLQLKYSAPDELMWNEQYWYKSAINPIIRNDLNDIAEKSQQLIELEKGDIVIDIGCNDGTLFDYFPLNDGLELIGFEPCKNVAKEAEAKGFKIIQNFFNAEDFKKEFDKKAKLITVISVFYDLENPNKFLEDIKSCLDKDGLFVIQQNYLGSMLENNAFDNICFEHRSYYSLYSLKSLLEKHGFEIFDIELNDINGGSIRTYVKFKENQMKGFEGAEQRISDLEKKEKEMELDTLKPYQEFAKRIENIKKELFDFIKTEKEKGKKFCGLGASTRGNTTLQYFELNSNLIECIFDRNPDKWGKKTIGTLISIKSPDEAKDIKHDYQIVFIWHLFKGIGDDEKEFLKRGGKFILPLPKFKIVEGENENTI